MDYRTIPATGTAPHDRVSVSSTTLRLQAGLCLLVLYLFGVPAHSQNITSTILGVVTDASGGGVPAAEITVTNEGTGISFKTVGDASGIPSTWPEPTPACASNRPCQADTTASAIASDRPFMYFASTVCPG